ncbi:ADP-ribose pyrophosphatase YjhB (NUDIX family) [Natronospira proteinivora]|uniref:Phosphatase NudJ n=1 Tax=Natronospira proteinivora TaxID=1807133 RepID=A0ABT1G756_9GAMM|nr:NUDIX hydrolase [Natronospira proteinivora]MCP1726790.1 ADP-ribose pyrophosphatase YjhB (NUDIX family) [Natronospira proteinivora]
MEWKPHVTVSAVVEDHGRFLLVEETIRGELKLNNPAGHLEEDESLVDAVIREVQEETARHFVPEAITGIYLWKNPGADKTFLRVNFFGHAPEFDPTQPLDTGIQRTLWLSREEIAAEMHRARSPLVLRCVDDYLAGRRYPLDALTHMADGFEE